MLIRSLPRGLFILLVFCGQEICAQEATKEPFYQQIVRAVIRLEEHQTSVFLGEIGQSSETSR